jgi:hypothetical protein
MHNNRICNARCKSHAHNNLYQNGDQIMTRDKGPSYTNLYPPTRLNHGHGIIQFEHI